MRIKEKLQHIIKNGLLQLNIDKKTSEIIISYSIEEPNSFYTDIAITIAKDLHKKTEEVVGMLKKIIHDEMIKEINIIHPGTLNIVIKKSYFLSEISEIIEKNIDYGKSNIGESRKINVDFINVDFTEGLSQDELFNAIYGDNLSRILKFNGFEVEKEFYFNDTLNKLEELADITKEKYNYLCSPKASLGINIDNIRDTANNIYTLYGNNKINEGIGYFKKEEINTLLDKRKRELDKYRINFDIISNEQSLYDKGLVDLLLDKLNRKGYTYFNNDSLWVMTTEYKDSEDRVIIKSDGTYTNLLSQAAYYMDKLNRKYDGIISVYNFDNNINKNTIKSVLTILEQDINKVALKILPKTNLSNGNNYLDLSVNEIRYLFSKQRIADEINIIFDRINKNDNCLEYIENTNIIIHQILKNYRKKITKVNDYSTINNPLAYIMVNKLIEFEDIVIMSGLKQLPHLICDYLYELCNLFNEYYTSEKIITEDEVYTNERLNLLLAIKIVINNAFDLIGIIPKEDM